MKKLPICLILLSLLLTACGDMSLRNTLVATVAEAKNPVYIGGMVGTSSTSTVPVYWKNGVLNYLPLSGGNTSGWAYAIAEDSSGNVYVAGGQGSQIGYWKNSTFTSLSLGSFSVSFGPLGIAVDTNGNVWLYGRLGITTADTYVYWKNAGSPIVVPGSSANVCSVRPDASGNVYFTGALGTYPNDLPTYWKNGVNPIQLPLSGGNTGGFADHLAKDSLGNLYIIGTQQGGTSGTACWKTLGGVWQSPIVLSMGPYDANGSWYNPDLAVDSSGNVCVARQFGPASSLTMLVYWKGLTSTPTAMSLPSGTSIVAMSGGGAAAFDANDNFIVVGQAGNTEPGGWDGPILDGVPVCWVNGSPIKLPMGSANTFGWAGLVVGP